MKILLLRAAQAELDDAADDYAEHASPRIAGAFLDDFHHARQRLAEHPEIGVRVSDRLRMLRLRRFPYSVIYRFSGEAITIHAIAHQRRRPGDWRAATDKA
jgi:plasmid stabilization system protein ParE